MQAQSGTCVRVKGAVDRIPAELKDAYRQFYLKADINQTRIATLLLTIPAGSFLYNDYYFFGFTWIFYTLFLIRVCMFVFTIWILLYLPRIQNYQRYDKLVSLYLSVVIIGTTLINFTRPQNAIIQVIIVSFGIFAIYLLFNTRFIYQLSLASAVTAEQSAILLLNVHLFTFQQLFTVFVSLISANLIAAVGAWQLHSYRWRLFHDIDERKKSERLATIGQVAGMVGHDLRNPLQTITGEVYLAKNEMKTLPKCEQKSNLQESIDAISEQTLYMDKIVSDLQTFVKPVEVHRQTMNLNQLIASLIPQIVIPHNINIHIQVRKALTVNTDPLLLKRVLNNLITNAVQAMPDGGELIIKAQTSPDGQVQIAVEDTGEGIPDEIKPKIFTPLFTTKAKGQGFGLAVCKRVIEAQNGTITFESQLGKGAVFTISLPQKNNPHK